MGDSMKVLHVIGQLGFGGAEVLCVNNLLWLAQNGHQAEVFSLQQVENSLESRLRSARIPVHYGSAIRTRNPHPVTRLNIGAILRLHRHLKSTRYDIVHVHLFPGLYYVAFLAWLIGLSAKLFYTEHSPNNRRNSALLKLLDRLAYRRYGTIICVSNDVRDALVTRLPETRNRQRVLAAGIDLARIRNAAAKPRAMLDLPADRILVANVGWFRKEKNQIALVRALGRLDARFHVVFMGAGEEEETCKAEARKLGVAERISFLGARSDVPEILKTCNLYVQVSLFEGFGMACFEAMAADIPVMTSDLPVLRDWIGPQGIYFDPANAQDIADKIGLLVQDQALQQQLLAHGRAVCAKLDEREVFAGIAQAYQQSLQTGGGA